MGKVSYIGGQSPPITEVPDVEEGAEGGGRGFPR